MVTRCGARRQSLRRRVPTSERVPSRPGMSPLAHYVVETLVTLLAIVALAVVVLVGARRAGMGRSAGPLELVGRLPLDARRAVYLVRVGTVIYVVGASEAGIAKLGEVTDGSIELSSTAGQSESFREVLSRALGKKA
jgi:flagellar protein FliO/FliZ